MKSSTLEGGESLCDMIPDNLTPPVLPPLSNVGLVGIVSSPPSVESVQFLPIPVEGSTTVGVFQGVTDPSRITSQQANFTHTFLKSILTSIDSKDPVVANAWLETLLDVIDLLPKEVVREEILGLAVTKGQSQQISSRLAACKLIGKISTKFESYILKSEIVGVVQSLCQDVSGEVRGSMCMQLASVARGVGLNTTKTLILPELVDLCSDGEVNVRLAGINTVVQMLPLVDQETRSNTLVPLVKKVCERALWVEDATLPVTAHLLGRICHGLYDDLTDEQKEWFLKFYCTLSKLGLPDAKKSDIGLPMPDLVVEVRSGEYEAECRQQCAYNLPAMIVFAGGSSGYRKHLHDTLLSFITDPSFPVRNTLALSFHQLCTLIGNEVGILREPFLNLLRSENLEVIAALVPNISHILAAFNHHQVITHSSQQTEVLELVGAIKQGEETVSESSNWRIHSEVLRQIAALALCLPPDLLFSEVVPLMIHRMHTVRPIPCRQAAARTLLVFLRHMDSKEQRDHICNTLVIEFCEGNSCHKRMLFLNVCRMSLDLLPRGFFKANFLKPLLALHTDPVPNIRLKLVSGLPLLKEILTLPDDRQRLQDLETVVGSLLMSETDKDVSASIGTVISQLDKIEVTESKRGSPEGQEIAGESKDPFAERRGKEGEKTKGSSLEKPVATMGMKKGTSTGGLSTRRTNVPGRIPPYVAAERRRSNTFAPELPPDEKAVKRGLWNKDCISDVDLSALCDEVLLSPEEPTSINWEDIVDSTEDDCEDRDFTLMDKDESNSKNSFPSIERLSLEDFGTRERKSFRIEKQDRGSRKSAKERFLEEVKSTSFQKKEFPYQSNGSGVKQVGKSKYLSGKYSLSSKDEGDANDLTPRQRFWMRTSRPKWRRKVASADTSPEEPRRSKFTRGNSIESGRTCFSDTEDPERHYNFEGLQSSPVKKSKFSKLQPVSITPVNLIDQSYDEPSPPSPHGMYTWPPQHTRHRHHGSLEDDENSSGMGQQHSKDSIHYKGNAYETEDALSENYGENLNSYRVNTLRTNFAPAHHKSSHVKSSSDSYNTNKETSSKMYENDDNFHSKQRQQSFSSHKMYDRSSNYFESSDEVNSFEKESLTYHDPSFSYRHEFSYPQRPVIPDPFNYHPNRRSIKNILKDEGYPKSSLNAVSKDTLSLLLSATPKSSKTYEDSSSGSEYSNSSAVQNQNTLNNSNQDNSMEEEDLYAVHGIPPTVPRRESSNTRNATSHSFSFPHEMSEEFFPSSFPSYPDTNLTNPYLTDIPRIPTDNKADLSYKEIRYHLAAAAAAAEQEWRESRRYDHRGLESKGFQRRGYGYGSDVSPSYVLMDSAEFAPWSSPPAYPIGPLGASWLQHGFHSHMRHPSYFIPPPLMRNRPLPSHSFPSSLSLLANQWPLAHHSSLHSISTLDPSADEFLVDAGIRIDESSLRSRIPPPTSEVSQRGRLATALNRHAQSNGPIRPRPPSNVSKIPVVGKASESLGPPLQSSQSTAGVVKTRPRVTQRPTRPISGVAQHAASRVSIGGSRGKSLSHENLRTSSRLGMTSSSSSSAKTSPVSSRPSSPNSLPHRSPMTSSRVRQSHGGGGGRSRTSVASPSGSRCSSPGDEEGRGRRGGSATSSPSSSRSASPGEEEPPRGNLQRRTTVTSRIVTPGGVPGRSRQNSSIPTMGGAARGRGSKLPLPTSKK